MGDTELAARLVDDVDETLEPVTDGGVKHYAKASTLSNFALFGGQVGNPGSHRARVSRGLPKPWTEGPVLDEAAYPDVLVARAVSDGRDLQLVLRPGAAGGRQRLGLTRLRPGATYEVRGAAQDELVAGDDGAARVDVDLDGRVELQVAPRE